MGEAESRLDGAVSEDSDRAVHSTGLPSSVASDLLVAKLTAVLESSNALAEQYHDLAKRTAEVVEQNARAVEALAAQMTGLRSSIQGAQRTVQAQVEDHRQRMAQRDIEHQQISATLVARREKQNG